MRTRLHSHPCEHCETPVECSGEFERNHDGFPEVICSDYHLRSGAIRDVFCESCEHAERLREAADAMENV
jgi:hypothetical protein